jgi:hypothetical protein
LGARLTIFFIDHLQTTSFLEERRGREGGRKRFRKEIITIKLREVPTVSRISAATVN